MLSSVRLEKSTAPPGGLIGVPSTSTLIKLELPPFRKIDAVPPSAPVRPIATPGSNNKALVRSTDCLASISSREIIDTGAVACSNKAGSASAVTTTLEDNRSSVSRAPKTRDSPAPTSTTTSSDLNGGCAKCTRYRPAETVKL